jgi:phosphoribosylformylglycinamidine synthase subunit PurL
MPDYSISQKLGLLDSEYDLIQTILGRDPNFTELSAYSVMWSEHCSYKNSIFWLKQLPKQSPYMLAEAGEENAGLVAIGDGLACAFKIESHNHPSALEPYQGAATGVGGINRDIFTMGARPVAQLNSLRFGNLKNERTKFLLKGVVKGIGDYGNSFGVPTVGGEVYFDDCYNTNPLVNAFSAGIVPVDKVARAIAEGVGNPVFIVGSSTGKDGIHGASFASEDITEKSSEKLPSVQVGDPFQEKLLLEATLEIIAKDLVVGVQDMGAAGIICSTAEMSAKGRCGMEINLDKVPLRQENMQAFEILLSESQERMLVVAKKGCEEEIFKVFDKWDLNCVQIATVTDTERLHFYHKGVLVADLPAESLVLGGGAPIYERNFVEPAYFKANAGFSIDSVPTPKNWESFQEIARFLLTSPNICSRRWISEQYDSMVGTAYMGTNIPSAAAVVLVKENQSALVMSLDCNSRYVYANPEVGTMIAVCEAARNVVCSGGNPVAITNNLNFGNPYNPEVYWQFVGAIQGMKKACLKLGTPVTGGNVSFYNQSSNISKQNGNVGNAIFPTPTIGMLGLMKDLSLHTSLAFQKNGDLILLLGQSKNDLNSSEYLYNFLGIKNTPCPTFDLEEEFHLQTVLKDLIAQKWVSSAHDVSDGGLLITLVESAMPNHLGFEIQSPSNIRLDAFLFGESQSRVVISISPDLLENVEQYLKKSALSYSILGSVIADACIIDQQLMIHTQEAKKLYDAALEVALS